MCDKTIALITTVIMVTLNNILWTETQAYKMGKFSKPCMQRNFGTTREPQIVCVCSDQYCDTLSPIVKTRIGTYQKYVTSKSGNRFYRTDEIFTSNSRTPIDFLNYILPSINLDIYSELQTIYGWGGHFTDSSGMDITSLSPSVKTLLMRSLFSNEGNEFSLCRVPMGGNVMSLRQYTYDDDDYEDPNLDNFQLQQEDLMFKIPLIKNAMLLTNNKLKLIAYPSSPPEWMKIINLRTGRSTLLKRYYGTFADYYVKFLSSYANSDIKFWGVSTGDTPSLGTGRFFPINTLGWNTTEHVQWIGENLGPTLKRSKYKKVKLLIFDDMRSNIVADLPIYLKNRKCLKYADGIAVQSYGNTLSAPWALVYTQTPYKDLFLLSTSAANGILGYYGTEKYVDLGSWTRAAYYIEDIITNLEFNAVGWLDFNLATNLRGGNTWNGMGFDAPIVVSATTNEFYKQPMFYVFGHFSKFLPPGSVRIKTDNDWTYSISGIQALAFRRPDNGYVIIVYNRGFLNRKVHINIPSRGYVALDSEAQSITNLVYW